LLKCSMVI